MELTSTHISLATVAWAIITWTLLRFNERNKEQRKLAALYINPFMLACEDLQSRLYNILQRPGLHILQEHYPEANYAEETLYLMLRYFGWEQCIYRYGPYTRDPRVIEFTASIRSHLATDKYGMKAFCFFRSSQRTLGYLVMRRITGEYGHEFETMPFHEFKDQNALSSGPFSGEKCVSYTLTALKNLKDRSESFDGLEKQDRERLVKIQNHLVDLLEYLEKKEGFSLASRKRQKATEAPPFQSAVAPTGTLEE